MLDIHELRTKLGTQIDQASPVGHQAVTQRETGPATPQLRVFASIDNLPSCMLRRRKEVLRTLATHRRPYRRLSLFRATSFTAKKVKKSMSERCFNGVCFVSALPANNRKE